MEADNRIPRILRPREVADRLGVSRVTLWRWERKGLIPKKRQVGPNTTGWLESEIVDWLTSRPVASSQGRRREAGEQEAAHESRVSSTRNSSEQA